MNSPLTDRQKNILGQALFRQIAYTLDTDEISDLAKKLNVLPEVAKYAHSVVAALDKKQLEDNKKPDDDPDGYKMDRYI